MDERLGPMREPTTASRGGGAMQPGRQERFLEELLEEHATIAGDPGPRRGGQSTERNRNWEGELRGRGRAAHGAPAGGADQKKQRRSGRPRRREKLADVVANRPCTTGNVSYPKPTA